MTREKELGYKLCDVIWHRLNGYKELWNKADSELKDEIINELGRLAIELTIPVVINWVAIADKQQPEICTEVLVRFKDGGTKCRFFDGDGRYYNTEQDMDITDYITHWAALPE